LRTTSAYEADTLKAGFLGKHYQNYQDSPFRNGGDYNFNTRDATQAQPPGRVPGRRIDTIRDVSQLLFARTARTICGRRGTRP
jgi:hypothetical protein